MLKSTLILKLICLTLNSNVMKSHVKFLLLLVALLVCKTSYSEVIRYSREYSAGATWVVHLDDYFDIRMPIRLFKEIPSQSPLLITTLIDVDVYMQGGLSVEDAGTYVFEGVDYKGEKVYLVITMIFVAPHAQLTFGMIGLRCCRIDDFMLKPKEFSLC